MSSKPITPMQQVWYRWKSLKLPWRKRFLVGLDLQGNTFWEFRDTLSSHKYRMRRIVQYPSSTHYSEIKISPQWHQWLRHTRSDPPSLAEQSQDLVRQQNLKVLAAQADAKWAVKPSYLDAPARQREQPIPALEVKDPRGYSESMEPENQTVSGSAAVGDSLSPELGEIETAVEQATRNEEYPGEMKDPDESRHHFNERPDQKNRPREKQEPSKVEDPWKQARGGPEEWQPKGWDGTIKAPRR